MNRFEKTRPRGRLTGRVCSVAVFIALLVLLGLGLDDLSSVTRRQEAEGLENTVRRSAVHCYALEGFYPDSLQYLEEHYGLRYDKDKYVIVYETLGANLMPDVRVIGIGG